MQLRSFIKLTGPLMNILIDANLCKMIKKSIMYIFRKEGKLTRPS